MSSSFFGRNLFLQKTRKKQIPRSQDREEETAEKMNRTSGSSGTRGSAAFSAGPLSLVGEKVREERGSLTAECAAVLPIFLLVIFALLSFFSGMTRELRRSSELQAQAASEAVQLGQEQLFDESAQSEDLEISEELLLQIPFLAAVSDYRLRLTAVRRVWNGKSFDGADLERQVYITTYGTVYHTSFSCPYLTINVREVPFSSLPSLRNKDRSIYYPCEYCEETAHGETVFVTDYGRRWHTDRSCAALKRGIRSVPLRDVGARPWCSWCRKMEE